MVRVSAELAGNSDRLRWNAKYAAGFGAAFTVHPLAVEALSRRLPPGPVLELASGLSGGVLLAAAAGRAVVAVDASDVALGLLEAEADRRGLAELVTLVHADLGKWRPEPAVLRVGAVHWVLGSGGVPGGGRCGDAGRLARLGSAHDGGAPRAA